MTVCYPRLMAVLLAAIALSLLAVSPTSAVQIDLAPPGEREFVLDLAGLLDANTKSEIQKVCERLLNEKATPIIVVTIKSIGLHSRDGMSLETFATLLFNQWQIGHAKIDGNDWNTGILLLVSVADRKARIELGGGWGRREDALCRKIMDEQIVSNFKQGRFAEGLAAGVESLDKMARKIEVVVPSRPSSPSGPLSPTRPLFQYVMVLAFIGLVIGTIISLIRNGSSGWAWVFWGVVFALVGALIYQMLTNSRSSNGSFGGGSFSGGSFGGGSSGGGGASGSW